MLTAHMRAGELEMLAQKIREIEPRRHLRLDALAIDLSEIGTGAVTQLLRR